MTEQEGRAKLQVGQAILLNNTAAFWTQGLIFEIDDVRSWGVRCWTTGPIPSGIVVVKKTGRAHYRAPWSEIAGRTSVAHPGLAASDLTGGYPD